MRVYFPFFPVSLVAPKTIRWGQFKDKINKTEKKSRTGERIWNVSFLQFQCIGWTLFRFNYWKRKNSRSKFEVRFSFDLMHFLWKFFTAKWISTTTATATIIAEWIKWCKIVICFPIPPFFSCLAWPFLYLISVPLSHLVLIIDKILPLNKTQIRWRIIKSSTINHHHYFGITLALIVFKYYLDNPIFAI